MVIAVENSECIDVNILDGTQRQTLAFTRSLGKKGIHVAVGADWHPSLASSSKYCSNSFSYPSPYKCTNDFVDAVFKHVKDFPGSILIPITDVTVSEVLRNRSLFSSAELKIPFVEYEKYNFASDKEALFRLAQRLGVYVPKTIFSTDYGCVAALAREAAGIGFPLVLKPARSRVYHEKGWIDTKVRYVNDRNEFMHLVDNGPMAMHPFLIQEKIEGPGMGIFLLMDNGCLIAQFAHKRIREKPPSGGVSVICESIEPPMNALHQAIRLLQELEWHGVAMVEFKLDRQDGLLKLMEINARLWGSLQLAISSGVDFPYLLYKLAMGDKISPVKDYKKGLMSRWELGDLDHLLIRLLKKSRELSLPRDAPSRMRVLSDFVLDFVRPSVRNEILRLDDPRPFFLELKHYMRELRS